VLKESATEVAEKGRPRSAKLEFRLQPAFFRIRNYESRRAGKGRKHEDEDSLAALILFLSSFAFSGFRAFAIRNVLLSAMKDGRLNPGLQLFSVSSTIPLLFRPGELPQITEIAEKRRRRPFGISNRPLPSGPVLPNAIPSRALANGQTGPDPRPIVVSLFGGHTIRGVRPPVFGRLIQKFLARLEKF
jgi:hypothetical protein